MKKLLIMLLTAFLMTSSVAKKGENTLHFEIDSVATANAPWQVGEVVREYSVSHDYQTNHPIHRVFLGTTTQGYYLMQDFYTNEKVKFSDPYLTYSEEGMIDDACNFVMGVPNGMVSIEGPLITWYESGQKLAQCHYENDTKVGHWVLWYSSGKVAAEATFKNGEMID